MRRWLGLIVIWTAAHAAPPEGMVRIPGGEMVLGAGEKEAALLERTREAFTAAARGRLKDHPRTADLAGAENLSEAIEARRKAVQAAIDQAERDLATAKQLGSEFPDDKYLITRQATLPAFIADQREALGRLDHAAGKIAFAESMDRWTADEQIHGEATVAIPPFYLDKHEVTVAEYREFCEATDREMPWPYRAAKDHAAGEAVELRGHPRGLFPEAVHPSFMADDSPIAGVSHADARAYAEWAGKRLPTELEWDWAARGGLDRPVFPWGDQPWDGSQANLGSAGYIALNPTNPNNVRVAHVTIDDGYPVLAPVGSYPANGYGLYDMAGNLAEWCAADPCYDPDLLRRLAGEDVPALDPEAKRRWGRSASNFMPLRGAAFNSSEFEARITRRYGPPKHHTHAERGFRCAQNIVEGTD